MQTLETKRLRLRLFTLSDLDDFYAYASVPGVGEMAGWPHHQDIETSRKILEGFIKDGDVYAIEEKKTGRVIGSLGLHDRNEADGKQSREVGYVLAKSHWKQGLMTEAVNRVVAHAFETLGYDYLTCAHFAHNDASRRVIEKTGFVFEKEKEYHAKLLDKTFLSRCYRLTRERHLTGKSR